MSSEIDVRPYIEKHLVAHPASDFTKDVALVVEDLLSNVSLPDRLLNDESHAIVQEAIGILKRGESLDPYLAAASLVTFLSIQNPQMVAEFGGVGHVILSTEIALTGGAFLGSRILSKEIRKGLSSITLYDTGTPELLEDPRAGRLAIFNSLVVNNLVDKLGADRVINGLAAPLSNLKDGVIVHFRLINPIHQYFNVTDKAFEEAFKGLD